MRLLIKTTVDISDPDKAKRKELENRLKHLNEAYVTIGIHQGAGKYEDGTSVLEVALWNEFGTRTAPERSFIRSAIDQNPDLIAKWQIYAMQKVVDGEWTAYQGLDYIGVNLRELIKSRITGYDIEPADSWATVQAKRSKGVTPPDMPLYETGLLLRSIERKVVIR